MTDFGVEAAVDLGLPIVQELLTEYGDVDITFANGDEIHAGTVQFAFETCGHLSLLGRLSPQALRAAIEDRVAKARAGEED